MGCMAALLLAANHQDRRTVRQVCPCVIPGDVPPSLHQSPKGATRQSQVITAPHDRDQQMHPAISTSFTG